MSNKGRFVWYALLTTDVEGARTFYTEAVGWKSSRWQGPMDYTMFQVGDRAVGGLMALPSDLPTPPYWLGYVAVEDVEASARRATELGGTILNPTERVPGVGTFCVIADPQGAVLSLFRGEGEMSPQSPLEAGDLSWHELNTTDYRAAWSFYSQLFGWQPAGSHDMGGELGIYFMFKIAGDDRAIGGMSNIASIMKFPAHWGYYIHVADLEAALDRVTAHGGQLVNGPMEVPGGDRIAQCKDPQGAAFALHATSRLP